MICSTQAQNFGLEMGRPEIIMPVPVTEGIKRCSFYGLESARVVLSSSAISRLRKVNWRRLKRRCVETEDGVQMRGVREYDEIAVRPILARQHPTHEMRNYLFNYSQLTFLLCFFFFFFSKFSFLFFCF